MTTYSQPKMSRTAFIGPDQTCQDILADPTRWVGVAQKVKQDWATCLGELQVFEETLEKEKIKRLRLNKLVSRVGDLLILVLNAFAGAALAVPLFIDGDPPQGLTITLNAITFVLSLGIWTRLQKLAYRHLILAEDIKRLIEVCRTIRAKLRDTMEDGRITQSERALIRDMIGQIHQNSEEISTFDAVLNILKGENTTASSEGRLFGNTKSYNNSFKGINEILNRIGRTQQEISVKLPHVVREYKDTQLQAQMYSSGAGMVVPPHPHVKRDNAVIVSLQPPQQGIQV